MFYILYINYFGKSEQIGEGGTLLVNSIVNSVFGANKCPDFTLDLL